MRRLLFLLAFLPTSLAAQDSLCVSRLPGGAKKVCVPIPVDTLVRVDTVTKVDTLIRFHFDTITRVDSVVRVDTLVRVDSVIKVDTLVRRDTTVIVRTDTLVTVRVDTLWLPRPDSTPADTIRPPPVDTLPPPPVDTLPPPPVDTTPPPPPPPVDTLPRGIAELPREQMAVPVGLDTLPCTQTVASGLQLALNAARGGAVLCLTGTHRANYTMPARSDTGWIVVRPHPLLGALPVGRMRPSQFAGATIASPNAFSSLTFAKGSRRTVVLGLRLTSDSALAIGPTAIVSIGTAAENALADLPSDIILDRVWCHGWPTQGTRRCVAGNGRRMAMVRSWCEEIHQKGTDSQCWISWNGAGPMLIEDNYLSAASEVLMFGGGDPRVRGLVPSDITIRRNHIYKPATWKGLRWNVKNLIEAKNSARVLVEENVIEGNYFDEQPGHAALVLKSTNQSGGCTWCSTSDWTVRRNLWRNLGVWVSIAGRADSDSTRKTDSTVRRIYIAENWVDSVSVAPYTNQNRYNLTFTTENYDVVIERNTVAGAGTSLEGGMLLNLTGLAPVERLTLRDNILPRGKYGFVASGVSEGVLAWMRAGNSTWSNNALIGQKPLPVYPLGTTWHTSLVTALGVAGVQRARIDAGVLGVVVPR